MAATAWRIAWAEQAVRDLAKLDPPIARRVLAKIEAAAADPPRHFARLVGADEHKLRVGDHRVLALLSHEARALLILRVGHRSTIYKRKKG